MQHDKTCVIAGGGPAGLMLGVLLARAGVEVAVLEKHADFLRDFRGDTIHPSTLEVMHELGWLDEFLTLPHQPTPVVSAQFGDERIPIADFSHLPVRAKFIAMMPQWDFLRFLADKGRSYPGFSLLMETEATRLIEAERRIAGVEAEAPGGRMSLRAKLVVAADGRGSRLRSEAGFVPIEFGAPMDVLWFRLPRSAGDPDDTQGRFDEHGIFIMINRGDYWQCARVIPKGDHDKVRAAGLAAFRTQLAAVLPFDSTRADALQSWHEVKLLTVAVNRLEKWARPGFLCIGDAAHAMSPVGGVGINLAVQDAVAAANLLAAKLRTEDVTPADLEMVQARRQFPTVATQKLQISAQKNIIAAVLRAKGPPAPPLALKLFKRFPLLRRIPARLIGLGVRPEHVASYIREGRGAPA